MKDGRPTLNDTDFIDNSNVLDYVSDGTTDYVQQLYLMDTIQFKYISVGFKKNIIVHKNHIRKYTKQTQVVYFHTTYQILKSLSKYDLKLSCRYQNPLHFET